MSGISCRARPARHFARRTVFLPCLIAAALGSLAAPSAWQAADRTNSASLPTRLTDREFWELSEALSEPGGTFNSDNLVSNESGFQKVLPALVERHPRGGVYLGVGPEQNFTYIAALDPAMAFILDIRRGNRDLHLMYKALFELATTRADFVSLLFSRPRPGGLTTESTAADIFAAFEAVEPSEAAYQQNLARVNTLLTGTHRLPLSADELAGIAYVYESFRTYGPGITYGSSRSRSRPVSVLMARTTGTYASLMQATDASDQPRSYLSSEARFSVVKALHARNLLVPVVGDFAGPKALRAIGDWLRARQARVSAFYLSNVEDYLRRGGVWDVFCRNAAALPTDEASEFIRSGGSSPPAPPPDPSAPPSVRRFTITSSAGGTTARVIVSYSDGSRQELTEAEALKMFPQLLRGGFGNSVGSIALDTRPCRNPG